MSAAGRDLPAVEMAAEVLLPDGRWVVRGAPRPLGVGNDVCGECVLRGADGKCASPGRLVDARTSRDVMCVLVQSGAKFGAMHTVCPWVLKDQLAEDFRKVAAVIKKEIGNEGT